MDIDREQDSQGRRWYFTPDGTRFMSVTTVLKELDEDETGLNYWKDDNDGDGDNADWEHLLWYSQIRGTLCHYQALVAFEHAFDGNGMWGDEESEAMKKAVNGPREPDPCDDHDTAQYECARCDEGAFENARHDNEDVVYSLLKDQDVVTGRDEFEHLFAESTRIVDVLRSDTEFFEETFSFICDVLGITDESVVAVERFMLNNDHGYGGQCDIVYEDPDGDVVVADLKTSSGLRQKHRLQSVAYANAVEQADDVDVDDVDRVEVIRIHPGSETWKAHSHEIPDHLDSEHVADSTADDGYTDEYWFEDKYGDFEYDSIEDMLETFQSLTEQAHDDVRDGAE